MAWPDMRNITYDPTLVYDGENEEWTDDVDIFKQSSGRYFNNVMIFGVDEDGVGKISTFPFFESPEEVAKDYYQENDNTSVPIEWEWPYWCVGQTFTASENYSLTGIAVKLLRTTDPTTIGTVTLNLYATLGGVPTGSSLASGTTDGDEVTTVGDGEWIKITLASPHSVVFGMKYAIILSASVLDSASPEITWRGHYGTPTYEGGESLMYAGSWTAYSHTDFMFRCYGE